MLHLKWGFATQAPRRPVRPADADEVSSETAGGVIYIYRYPRQQRLWHLKDDAVPRKNLGIKPPISASSPLWWPPSRPSALG